MPFKSFRKVELSDAILVEFANFPDERGFFAELYKITDFLANGVPYDFVQVNLSFSRRGVVRGLHYQLRLMEQGKLVYVVSSRVYDVAVDIRRVLHGMEDTLELRWSQASLYGYHQASHMDSKLSKTRTSYT